MTRLSNDEPLNYEVLHVIYNGICKTIVQHFDYTNKMYQFKDLLSEVEYQGGVIKLWADNPKSGVLFEYGSHNDCFWYKVGETIGYL